MQLILQLRTQEWGVRFDAGAAVAEHVQIHRGQPAKFLPLGDHSRDHDGFAASVRSLTVSSTLMSKVSVIHRFVFCISIHHACAAQLPYEKLFALVLCVSVSPELSPSNSRKREACGEASWASH
jgi:hypothetical protein